MNKDQMKIVDQALTCWNPRAHVSDLLEPWNKIKHNAKTPLEPWPEPCRTLVEPRPDLLEPCRTLLEPWNSPPRTPTAGSVRTPWGGVLVDEDARRQDQEREHA